MATYFAVGVAQADAAANQAPDAPVVYTEVGVQTELDKLKANDDALRTVLNGLLGSLRGSGQLTS